MSARIDVARLRQLAGPHALEILERRGMVIVGRRDAAEVSIRNANPTRASGKGRGDQSASASWSSAKGVFVDHGDASFNGDIIKVVRRCDGVDFDIAAARVAEEAGVALPMLARAGASQSARADLNGQGSDLDSDLRKKIEAARRKWAKAGPLRDSCSETYLAKRGIVLQHEEPWLRSNDSAGYWIPPRFKGEKPEKIATMPAFVAASTVAGAGEPVAVIERFYEHSDDGEVTLKPRIVDPKTGLEYKNKRVRGDKTGAGVFVGQHLLEDTIVVTEGVEDALSAVMAGYAAVAKLSSNSLADLELQPCVKRVIVAGDNDRAGQDGIAKAATVYASRGFEVLVPRMPDGIKDLNELLVARGAAAVRSILDQALPWSATSSDDAATATDDAASREGEQTEKLYERFDDVEIRSPDYLVKGLLVRGANGLIFGASTVGKSFVALTIAAHIAKGLQFGKHRVRRFPVIYVGLEGQAELGKRIMALRRQLGPFEDRLVQIRAPLVLKRGEEGDRGEQQIVATARQLQAAAGQPVGLIVVDTLWQAMGGDDENDASAMSHFLSRIANIRAATGAAVMLVHHVGKDATKGPRGSSALMPAMDFQAVAVRKGRQRSLQVEKNKDGADGQVFNFELEVVELGADDEGDVMTSCVAHFDFAASQSTKKARQAPAAASQASKALEQLRELTHSGQCMTARGDEGVPEGAKIVKLAAWRTACEHKRLTVDEAKSDSERTAFKRACERLEKMGWVARTADWVWLVDP